MITQLLLSCMYACFLPRYLQICHQNRVSLSPWLLTSVSSWKPLPSAPASESQELIGTRVPRNKSSKMNILEHEQRKSVFLHVTGQYTKVNKIYRLKIIFSMQNAYVTNRQTRNIFKLTCCNISSVAFSFSRCSSRHRSRSLIFSPCAST